MQGFFFFFWIASHSFVLLFFLWSTVLVLPYILSEHGPGFGCVSARGIIKSKEMIIGIIIGNQTTNNAS